VADHAAHAAHAWDLARAAGLEIEIPNNAVETALATMRVAVSLEMSAAGMYGSAQPAPQDALDSRPTRWLNRGN
jgi:hypothetical protein